MWIKKLFLVVCLVLLLVVPLAYPSGNLGTGALRPLGGDTKAVSHLLADRGFQAIRQNLKEYSVYLADQKTILMDARKGELHLEIRDKKFELVLEPDTKTLHPNATDRPIFLFRGRVRGYPDSSVVVGISDRAVMAIIRVGREWYYLEPTKVRVDGRLVVVGYSSRDEIPVKVDLSNDVIYPKDYRETKHDRSENWTPKVFPPEPTTYTIDLLAGYDPEFKDKAGDPQLEISTIMANVNNIFNKYGIYIRIKAFKEFHVLGADACEALNGFESPATSAMEIYNTDLAFLFSGKSFSKAIGCAYQYRGRIAVGQMYGSGFNRIFVATHEFGHNFDADHENTPGYNQAYSWYDRWYHTRFYTIMWSVAPDEYKYPEFSDKYNHGDETHDNARRIKETAPVIQNYS